MNWCIGAVHGKTLFGSYVPLYGVGLGMVGAVGLCACVPISGTKHSTMAPVRKNSVPSVIRAAVEEEFFFICLVVFKISLASTDFLGRLPRGPLLEESK